MQLYNSETRQKEELKSKLPGKVTLYTCGPTIYDFAHIGNFRTYVFEDVLRRTLKFFGWQVVQAMNITDIDDKTIRGAIAKGIPLKEYTQPYKEAFFADLKALNIEPVEFYPEATAYIPKMIGLIEVLLKKGVAYIGKDGSIYFSIAKFPRYGRLSHLEMDELKPGAGGVAADEYDKDNVADFVLWKKYDEARDGKIFWESPFGHGRPGWHIECSAMAMELLGETIDIHVGGVDNLFPHHENEIAQSEACTGVHFVGVWLHAEHLLVDYKKMSKSLGNFYTLRDLLQKGFTGVQVRYLLLQTHYRTQLNFTFTVMEAAVSSLDRLHAFVDRLSEKRSAKGKEREKVIRFLEKGSKDFEEALADDLNISAALAALFDLVRELNALDDVEPLSAEEAEKVLAFLRRIDAVLGVLFVEKEEIPAAVQEMAQKRQAARKAKEWKLADQLRDQLAEMGYTLEDKPDGTVKISSKEKIIHRG